jgi:hypothetical protein
MRQGGEREPVYHVEHWIGYVMALGAVVLGFIGAIVAFGVLNVRTLEIAQDPLATPGNTVLNFQDGMLFILPAIAAAFLAFTLHMTEHHNRTIASRERGMFMFEHGAAYLMAGLAFLFGVLTPLIGFDVFNRGNQVFDGYVWGMLAVGSGILTTALHAVGHHQLAADEEYISRLVEQRVAGTARPTAPGPATRAPETEPRR